MQIKDFRYQDYNSIDEWQDALNAFSGSVQVHGLPNSLLPTPSGMMVMYGIPYNEYVDTHEIEEI